MQVSQNNATNDLYSLKYIIYEQLHDNKNQHLCILHVA